MNHWLFKSEPDVFSLDDLRKRPRKTDHWDGIRNYQARNFMRDDMRVGDLGLFYHSNCPQPGIAGVVRVAREAYPDHTAWDPASRYFDAASTPDNPRWFMVDLQWVRAFPDFVPLATLKNDPALEGMLILRKGNRLSITPVDPSHFLHICRLGGVEDLP